MSRNGWWLVARTKIIDDAITQAIADGCDRVLNLAAGLDTRPYRLQLPAEFTWVEADLPKLLEEKTRLLADQTPRCRLTRAAVDLADPGARAAFLDAALGGATKALVLTEGLLMYVDTSSHSPTRSSVPRSPGGCSTFPVRG
jgi:methyltransferase (TIGR00027 family)